jgi:hypothetical protein
MSDDNVVSWGARLLFNLGWHTARGSEFVDPELEMLRSLGRFMAVIGHQDERAMVLSMAAFLEDTLGRILLAYLRDCKATRDLVEGFNAPLGTLSARIRAAYSFGLIEESTFKDLEILRRIRNHFAHDWEGVSLQRNDIAALLGQLQPRKTASTSREPLERPWKADGDKGKLLESFTGFAIWLSIVEVAFREGKLAKGPDVASQLAAASAQFVSGPEASKPE